MLVILSFLTIFLQNLYAKWDVLDTLKAHTDSVNSVAFRPDGQLLASGSKGGTVILWNPLTGKKIKTLTEHNDNVYSVAFGFDELLASASLDGTIILWHSTKGEKLRLLTHNGVRCITFSPDGQFLVSGSLTGEVKIWNSNTGKEQLQDIPKHGRDVTSVTFSPDGTLLASGSYDYTVRLWDFKNPEIVETLKLMALESPVSEVYSVTFISDSQLAIGLQDGTIKLWDFTKDTGTGVKVLREHESAVTSVAFSSQSQLLASGSSDGTIKLWYPNTSPPFSELITLKGHSGPVNSVVFSPDGKILASSSADGTVKLWQSIILSVHIKDKYSFPKTIKQNELLLEFILKSPKGDVSEAVVRYSYILDDEEWVELPEKENSVLLRSLKDGEHKVEVKATSTIWDIDPTPAVVNFFVSLLPDTFITRAPESPVKTDTVIFQFSGQDSKTPTDKLRYSWRFNESPWSIPSTKATVEFKDLEVGYHHFAVKAIDEDNNEDATPAYKSLFIDIKQQLPETEIVELPKSPVKTASVTFKFSGQDSQTPTEKLLYSWRIDDRAWSEPSAETKAEFRNLSNGPHSFEVKAIDADGNNDPEPARELFVVTMEFPETRIVKAPEYVVETESFTFHFTGFDAQIPNEKLKYSWRIDEENWTEPLPQTKVTLHFSDGRHWFKVKAIAADGREDPTPAEVSFTVDKYQQLPNTEITNAPKSSIKTPDFIFQFTGTDSQTPLEQLRYSWRVDKGSWSIPSPDKEAHPKGLSDGLHLFEVKAIDADDNEDPIPAKAQFQIAVDKKWPDTIIPIEFPDPIETTSFEIPFRVTNTISTDKVQYQWRVNGGAWSQSSPEMTAALNNLTDGQHIFEVKAIVNGNEDPIPDSKKFMVDTKDKFPDTEIIDAPKAPVETADVTIYFRGKDSQTPEEKLKYIWRIDGKPWSKEALPETIVRLRDLSNGKHAFEVKAIDVDGNQDPTPDAVQFEVAIDKKFPDTEILDIVHEGLIRKTSVKISFTGRDSKTPTEQLQYSWRLDDNSWSTPSMETMVHRKDLSNRKYTFQVKVIDADGNEDPTPDITQFTVVVPFYSHPFFLSIIIITFLSTTIFIIIVLYYIRRSRAFQKEFNPYQAGEPIINPEKFYGRTVEIGKIKSILKSGSVIVHGERRIGKTSVLRQIEQTIDGKFIPCFVQLGDTTQDTFFKTIGKGIATGCNKFGILTNDLLMETQHNGYDGLDLREDIKRIIDRMKGADPNEKLLVIIDEVDVTNNFPSYIQESIRAIAQDFTSSLKFLAAGTYIRESEDDVLFYNRPSSWYNAFRHIEIKPLSEKEALELIKDPVGKAYRYSPEAADYIITQSLRRPYVIQMICHHIIERMKIRRKTRIRLEDAEIAFAEAINEFDTHLRNLWVRLPEQIQKALKTQDYLEYTADSNFIELLENEGMVWRNGINTSPSPIFAEWIRRN